MFYVETAPYCEYCTEFEPEAEVGEILTYINDKPLRRLGNTTIRCKHHKKCDTIKKHLEQYLTSCQEDKP